LNPQLLTYLGGRFASGTALTLMRATVSWHMYELTGSKVLLGMIGLAQFLPAVVMALTGGIVADRTNRTAVVRWCQIAVTWIGPALVLALVKAPEHAQFLLFGAVAIVAAFGSFESPSRAALLVSLVSKKEYPRAVTRAATIHALAFASGPTIAGFVIAGWGVTAAYIGHTILMLISIGFVSMLPAARPEGEPTRESPLQSMMGGFRYVLSNRIVLACMALDMLAVMLGGASALLPVFAEDILQVGPRGYGLLSASMETGALLMSLYLAWRRPIRSAGAGLILSVVAYGIVTVLFGASRLLPLSIIAYGLVGAADQISVVLRHTTVQMSTDDSVRGRVSSINMLFIHASNQLGALESGLLAAVIGAPAAVMFGGAGAIVIALIIALVFPALRYYRIDQEESE
jgi:MFS family permease